MPKLTISLVTYNGAKYLPYCLESVLGQTFQDFRLVVLDNASKDDSVQIIEGFADKFQGRFELIKKDVNVGFAKGHNEVMGQTQTEYIFLLNQDIMLEPDYLEECVKLMERNPVAGAVSGKILKWDFLPPEAQNPGLNKSRKTNIIDSLGLEIFRSQKVIERFVGETDREEFSRDVQVFGVSGTVPIYRKSALESVAINGIATPTEAGKYFDESFFMYKEDVDLAYRLQWGGWQAWVAGKTAAFHDRSAKSMEGVPLGQQFRYRRTKPKFINYHSYKNHLSLLIKNLSGVNFLRCLPWLAAYELKKFFYFLIFEPATLKSLAELRRRLPELRRQRGQILDAAKSSDREIARWFV